MITLLWGMVMCGGEEDDGRAAMMMMMLMRMRLEYCVMGKEINRTSSREKSVNEVENQNISYIKLINLKRP